MPDVLMTDVLMTDVLMTDVLMTGRGSEEPGADAGRSRDDQDDGGREQGYLHDRPDAGGVLAAENGVQDCRAQPGQDDPAEEPMQVTASRTCPRCFAAWLDGGLRGIRPRRRLSGGEPARSPPGRP
jgi:hypothetical protein